MNEGIGQERPKCDPRASFTWPAALVSHCIIYGSPNPGDYAFVTDRRRFVVISDVYRSVLMC